MKRFVVGDIHGEHEKLLQCLERSEFDKEKDLLISLGDVVDRGPDSFNVVEELLSIKNLIAIRGNHDKEFLDFIEGHPYNFIHQGGDKTIESYIKATGIGAINKKLSGFSVTFGREDVPQSHVNFFKNQVNFYILESMLFVHGGYNRHFDINDPIHNNENVLLWDRDLFLLAFAHKQYVRTTPYTKVFLGHTPTTSFDVKTPIKAASVINVDTGACFGGHLTFYNIDTEEIFKSDL